MTEGAATELMDDDRLCLTRPDGRRETLRVRFGRWSTEPCAQTRPVYNGDSLIAVQRAVPESLGERSPLAYDLLETEARVGVRLCRRFGAAYPAELVRLLGYDLGGDTPFLLLAPPLGAPVGAVAGQLSLERQREFAIGLFRALLALEGADVVHGDLNPACVYWDGHRVQVGGLAHGRVVGESRRHSTYIPWATPEQRAGTGEAAVGDDTWAAGMLVYHVVTGRSVAALRGVPALANRGPALRALLDGVFATAPAARPSAAAMLLRLRVEPVVPVSSPEPDPAFNEGLQRFDATLAQKWSPRMERVVSDPIATRRRARKSARTAWILIFVPVVIAVVAAAVWGLR